MVYGVCLAHMADFEFNGSPLPEPLPSLPPAPSCESDSKHVDKMSVVITKLLGDEKQV